MYTVVKTFTTSQRRHHAGSVITVADCDSADQLLRMVELGYVVEPPAVEAAPAAAIEPEPAPPAAA